MTLNPVPKPMHKRLKPKRSSITKITKKARNEVYERANGACEMCGRTNAFAFEVAHLKPASQGGSGSDPANLVLLCGPSVNSGTCHWFADSTAEGRDWRMNKRKELMNYYA